MEEQERMTFQEIHDVAEPSQIAEERSETVDILENGGMTSRDAALWMLRMGLVREAQVFATLVVAERIQELPEELQQVVIQTGLSK